MHDGARTRFHQNLSPVSIHGRPWARMLILKAASTRAPFCLSGEQLTRSMECIGDGNPGLIRHQRTELRGDVLDFVCHRCLPSIVPRHCRVLPIQNPGSMETRNKKMGQGASHTPCAIR